MRKKRTLSDVFEYSRVVYLMYALILIVAFFLIYFVIVRYVVFKSVTANKLTVQMMNNDLQEFTDGTHPVVTLKIDSRLQSVLHINLESDRHSFNFSSGDLKTEYTKLIVLPLDAVGTDFTLRVTAEDKVGNVKEKMIRFKTKDVEKEVTFSVR